MDSKFSPSTHTHTIFKASYLRLTLPYRNAKKFLLILPRTTSPADSFPISVPLRGSDVELQNVDYHRFTTGLPLHKTGSLSDYSEQLWGYSKHNPLEGKEARKTLIENLHAEPFQEIPTSSPGKHGVGLWFQTHNDSFLCLVGPGPTDSGTGVRTCFLIPTLAFLLFSCNILESVLTSWDSEFSSLKLETCTIWSPPYNMTDSLTQGIAPFFPTCGHRGSLWKTCHNLLAVAEQNCTCS